MKAMINSSIQIFKNQSNSPDQHPGTDRTSPEINLSQADTLGPDMQSMSFRPNQRGGFLFEQPLERKCRRKSIDQQREIIDHPLPVSDRRRSKGKSG